MSDVGRDEAASTPMSKVTIIKNLAIVCVSFLLCFTAYTGTKNLQSSLYPGDNLGNNSSAIINFSAVVSNILLSTVVLYKLGLKWSLVVSLLTHAAYPASNLFPVWYSMYSGAAITGLGGGPMWNAKSAYLTMLAKRYAELSGQSPEVLISRFFGIFFMLQRGSSLTGSLISSVMIRRPPSTHVSSDDDDVIIRSVCGAHFCCEDLDVVFGPRGSVNGSSSLESIYHPTTVQINLLFGFYVVCGLLAVPLAAAIDPIGTSGERKSMKIVQVLLSTVRHMKNPKEILVLPLSLLNGITFAFIVADFSIAFITCSIGIDNVGYVMAVFGVAAGLGSVLTAPLLKYVGRQVIFAIGGLCNAAALVGMLTWSPAAHSMTVLCIFAALMGIANAVWASQLVAFIAFVFRDGPTEAAFTCNYLWQNIGVSLWHATSKYMCLHVQIYVIAAILTAGMAGYTVTELMLRAEEAQKTGNHQPDTNIQSVFTVEKFTYLSEESRDICRSVMTPPTVQS